MNDGNEISISSLLEVPGASIYLLYHTDIPRINISLIC